MISNINQKTHTQHKNQKSLQLLLWLFLCFSLAFVFLSSQALASFDCSAESPLPADCIDTPTTWTNFDPANGGYTASYTFLGQPISDHTQSSDPTNGGTGVGTDTIDLASGSPNANPGPYDTPAYGYYDGGTEYDPLTPATLEDDYLLFRMRLLADPSTNKDDLVSSHWNILVDVDDDGYKEYWVDVNGSAHPSQDYDQLQILYNNDNSQVVTDPAGDRVNEFYAYNTTSPGDGNSSFTRVLAATDGTSDYFLEVQVPMTAFNDASGNQTLFPDSPVGFVFSTSNSTQNPLQKDWMMDLDYISDSDPITFGDVVTINGDPIIEFVNSDLEEVSFYEEGDYIYTFVKHPFADTTDFLDEISITVTNPSTDDDEELTLCESSPHSGLFTNRGGAEITSVDDPDNGWISSLTTSNSAGSDTWSIEYDSGSGEWLVYKNGSGIAQNNTVTAGTEYFSDSLEITFTLYEDSPADGDTIEISTCAADPLPWEMDNGIPHDQNDDGELEFSSGDTIQFSYTYTDPYSNVETLTTDTPIVGAGEPYIEFTRSSGLPNTDFELKEDYTESDKIYVTVTHDPAEYTPGVVDTITVTLSGNDSETLTLTETGPDTGIFRNTTGLDTQIDDGTGPIANRWEDVDSAEVTATYNWDPPDDDPDVGAINYTTTANLFYVNGAGRVYFTNSSGTADVNLYTSGDEVYIKVEDANEAGSGFLTVTLTNKVLDDGSGDTETITVNETAAGSGVFLSSSGFTINTIDVGDSSSILQANHDTIITVEYTDLVDGDSDTGNDIKTDTATYFDPPVLINEVFFYPTGTDTYDGQTEYFQIYNSSASSEDIFGYTITDGDGFTYTFPEDPRGTTPGQFFLPAGEYAYVFLYSTFENDPAIFDTYIVDTFYLFTDVSDTAYPEPPSEELGDPDYALEADRSDQLTLKDASGITQDYVAWSSTASPSIDFLSDDSAAVSQGVWQENDFRDVYTASIPQGSSIKRVSDGFDTDGPSDWVYNDTSTFWDPDIGVLTPVGISSFNAHADKKGRVSLRWETAYESGTVGFYIFRKSNNQFMYELVNKKLIPALIGSPQGGSYQYNDKKAVAGETYSYLLEEVVETGERIEYGPFEVTATNSYNGDKFSPEFIRSAREMPAFAKKRQELRQESKSLKNKGERGDLFSRKNKSGTGSLKISIHESGLYHISSSEIAEHFGLTEQKVDYLLNKYKMKLSSQGRSVPYFVDRENPGIHFYGFEYKDVFTDENVFWLSLDSGQRMKNVNLKKPRGFFKNQSFNDTIHFEEESFPIYSRLWDNNEDYWAWGYFFCGAENLNHQTYDFYLNDVVPTTDKASLTVHFVGGSIDGAGDDHLAEISLNGTRIGACTWKGIEKLACELSFSQQFLNEGNNVLAIDGILIGDAGFSLFYVDSFDVNYQRYYQSVDNSIQFPVNTNTSVSISGFDSNKIYLLDVSSPYKPKLASRTKITKDNSYWLSFRPKSPAANYLALSSSALKQVNKITLENSSGLKNKRNAADYLIITPAELKESVQELSDYRSGQGYTVKIVELDQIINEFNDGIYSPMAIKKFLTYAHSKWKQTPEFVILIGAATYDYRDVGGYGGNLMPTALISSQNGFFASDGYLADVDDDNVPDMAIGRLPVLTPEELQNIILKIKIYEYSSEKWKNKMLLLADEPDGDVNFAWDSEQISHLIPTDHTQKKIYLSNFSLNSARQKLFTELDDGAGFVNYFGHGGPDQLAQYGLLLSDDVNTLSTNGGAPIVTAMTCAVGEFIFTNFDTLAELMLLQPNGGATAVWSASGLSENNKATRLGEEFYKAIYTEGHTVLGKAILKSFQNYSLIDDDPYHILIYNLLGDPALKIR